MNDLSVLARVRAVIGDEAGLPAADCTDDATLASLGLDSIDVVQLAINLEDHFDVKIPEDSELLLETTVKQTAGLVDRLRSGGMGESQVNKDVTRGSTADRPQDMVKF